MTPVIGARAHAFYSATNDLRGTFPGGTDARDLEQHMIKEEHVLFPYIAELASRGEACGRAPSPFGTVENPIRMM